MRKYTLDQSGVDQWLDDLKKRSIQAQMEEQVFVGTDFRDWLSTRFILTEDQVQYADNLYEDFVTNLGQEIASCINLQLPITFDRQEADASARSNPRDSVKVTEYQKKQRQAASASMGAEPMDPEEEVSTFEAELTVRIYYQPIEQ